MIQRVCSEMGILHLSVGIGLEVEGENNSQIGGMVKVETNFNAGNRGTAAFGDFADQEGEEDNVYRSNIQTAEVNMMGAALAIAEWKARKGVYRNERDECNDSMMFSLATGEITVDQKSDVGLIDEIVSV